MGLLAGTTTWELRAREEMRRLIISKRPIIPVDLENEKIGRAARSLSPPLPGIGTWFCRSRLRPAIRLRAHRTEMFARKNLRFLRDLALKKRKFSSRRLDAGRRAHPFPCEQGHA